MSGVLSTMTTMWCVRIAVNHPVHPPGESFLPCVRSLSIIRCNGLLAIWSILHLRRFVFDGSGGCGYICCSARALSDRTRTGRALPFPRGDDLLSLYRCDFEEVHPIRILWRFSIAHELRGTSQPPSYYAKLSICLKNRLLFSFALSIKRITEECWRAMVLITNLDYSYIFIFSNVTNCNAYRRRFSGAFLNGANEYEDLHSPSSWNVVQFLRSSWSYWDMDAEGLLWESLSCTKQWLPYIEYAENAKFLVSVRSKIFGSSTL